jgi:hypothetical protein
MFKTYADIEDAPQTLVEKYHYMKYNIYILYNE